MQERERIARVIEPQNWKLIDHWRAKLPTRPDLAPRAEEIASISLAKADEIIAILARLSAPADGREVTQADRDAAAETAKAIYYANSHSFACEADVEEMEGMLVQAFVRHRSQAVAEGEAGDLEAARPLIAAIAQWERKNGTLAGIMPHEYEAFCKLIAAAAVTGSARAAIRSAATQAVAVEEAQHQAYREGYRNGFVDARPEPPEDEAEVLRQIDGDALADGWQQFRADHPHAALLNDGGSNAGA